MDIQALATGTAALITGYGIENVYDYGPDNPNLPAVIVPALAANITYDLAYQRGLDTVSFSLTVLVAKAFDRPAQTLLASYVASGAGKARSIKNAVEQWRQPSFGWPDNPIIAAYPACTKLLVTQFRMLSHEEVASYQAVGGSFTIEANVEGP